MAVIIQSTFRSGAVGTSPVLPTLTEPTPNNTLAYDFAQEKEHWKPASCLEFCAPRENWSTLYLQISNRLYTIKAISTKLAGTHTFYAFRPLDTLREAIKDLKNLSEHIIDDLLNLSEHPLVQSARLSGAEAIAETKEGWGAIHIALAKNGSQDANPFDNPLLLIRLTSG